MRASVLATLAAALATTPLSASAAQLVQGFNVTISAGPLERTFNSTPFDLFDPSMGTLQSVTASVSGSLVWDTGDAVTSELTVADDLISGFGNLQNFASPEGGGQSIIHAGLNGPGDPVLFEGKGTSQEELDFSKFPAVRPQLFQTPLSSVRLRIFTHPPRPRRRSPSRRLGP